MERVWLFADYSQAESRVVSERGPVPQLRRWYREGKDVHLLVTKLVARTIQERKISIYNDLFRRKHWDDYVKDDEEREQCKRIVHGGNYLVGYKKVAVILGVPESVAKLLLEIYFGLFPEIKTNYHAWVRHCLNTTRTIWTPEPVPFRAQLWDKIDEDTIRAATARYPQSTVARMTNRVIGKCCAIFREDKDETLKDIWCAYYGTSNWDHWRKLRDHNSHSPQTILWNGMDVRLNVHDAGGISIPNDRDLISWAAKTWKAFAETPIQIDPKDPLVIPVDFKIGPSWGELKKYEPA